MSSYPQIISYQHIVKRLLQTFIALRKLSSALYHFSLPCPFFQLFTTVVSIGVTLKISYILGKIIFLPFIQNHNSVYLFYFYLHVYVQQFFSVLWEKLHAVEHLVFGTWYQSLTSFGPTL